MRREALSILHTVYDFVRAHRNESVEVPDSVRFELRLMRGIIPLLEAKLDLQWGSKAWATDASDVGVGVCERELASELCGRFGRVSDKLRFISEDFAKARKTTLSQQLGQSGEIETQADHDQSCDTGQTLQQLSDPECSQLQREVNRQFEDIPISVTDPLSWRIEQLRRFRKGGNIMRTEGLALIWAVRRACRSPSLHHSR